MRLQLGSFHKTLITVLTNKSFMSSVIPLMSSIVRLMREFPFTEFALENLCYN